ncbi:hypothetical protein N658DRAFT_494394 [Parathielavia hyrcaniae]|uniref:Uncharacterized protein n=1 Tax=Parathielavia hyrcaniae TaxID=113614 RepID=A0AAN6Q563_9PEZI|nr:hypothetical protein N658DRAFT_494394 [Parathielavia hyrcaniae]
MVGCGPSGFASHGKDRSMNQLSGLWFTAVGVWLGMEIRYRRGSQKRELPCPGRCPMTKHWSYGYGRHHMFDKVAPDNLWTHRALKEAGG